MLAGVALGEFKALQLIAGVFLQEGFGLGLYLLLNLVFLVFNHFALALAYFGVVAGYSLAALL